MPGVVTVGMWRQRARLSSLTTPGRNRNGRLSRFAAITVTSQASRARPPTATLPSRLPRWCGTGEADGVYLYLRGQEAVGGQLPSRNAGRGDAVGPSRCVDRSRRGAGGPGDGGPGGQRLVRLGAAGR